MILAGGQGTRLGMLTKNIAKPALPFGGKYRIIDFTLSNCSNSGIDTVGVLTQYEPLVLNSYIGIGSHWDLDKKSGGVMVLPPYVKENGGNWYRGTADAVYQNLDFVEHYEPEYLLVLSGDHIYKMDYSAMLKHHKEKQADATIAVIRVPSEETYRFGIMNTDEEERIIEFQEKPENAKSDLASMGVYIFNWKKLKKHLIEEDQNPDSSLDFGKNIIPKMLNEGEKLFAYGFQGYWKDVGTVESYWEANMDLIEDDASLDLHERNWIIYSVNPSQPPQYIGPSAKVTESLLNEGCQIFGEVSHSVIFPGVYIGKGAVVKDSVIMANAIIGDHAKIEKSIIAEKAIIQKKEIIGDNKKNDITVVAT